VLYFYTENGAVVALREWNEAHQANSRAADRLLARVRFVELAARAGPEARPDLYDHNVWLWLFAWGDFEIFYTLRPMLVTDKKDVHIVGVAPTANHDAVVKEMNRRVALIPR
jgi:hypothetical protein